MTPRVSQARGLSSVRLAVWLGQGRAVSVSRVCRHCPSCTPKRARIAAWCGSLSRRLTPMASARDRSLGGRSLGRFNPHFFVRYLRRARLAVRASMRPPADRMTPANGRRHGSWTRPPVDGEGLWTGPGRVPVGHPTVSCRLISNRPFAIRVPSGFAVAGVSSLCGHAKPISHFQRPHWVFV